MTEIFSAAVMLLCVAAILFLAYWFTRHVASGKVISGGSARSHMRVRDRLSLGTNKMLLIVSIGERWLVLGVTGEQITQIAELDPEQIQAWEEQDRQGTQTPAGFADILSNALRGKNEKG